MIEMKIAGIEQGSLLEPAQVGNPQLAMIKLDQAIAPQFLHDPVDMDTGHSSRVGQVILGEREGAGVAAGQPDRAQSMKQLDHQMREMLMGVSLTHAEDPFPLDRCSDQLIPGNRLADARISRGKCIHLLPSDLGISEMGDGADAVVHLSQEIDVGIAQVAGNEKGQRLAPAIG